MIRFRLNELINKCNEEFPNEILSMSILANEIGSHRSTLANLTTVSREPVTNTALVEALARYFSMRLPDFSLDQLIEFTPSLSNSITCKIEDLYPRRASL